MVAYSFQKRFAEAIVEGRKRQTIRANRKRHARPGEELQLYVGMRTRQCRLLLRTRCAGVYPIVMCPLRDWAWIGEGYSDGRQGKSFDAKEVGLDQFDLTGRFVAAHLPGLAYADGFSNWPQMRHFWFEQHEKARDGRAFIGVLVTW